MVTINLPYGKGKMPACIDETEFAFNGVFESGAHAFKSPLSEEETVIKSLETPIGSPRLCDLAKGKKNIVIIASDHTRPVPSKKIMPAMLREIRKGSPDANITILIATGCHRGTVKSELINKFGEDIVNTENIVIHDCDNSPLVYLGKLPSGGELIINKLAVGADLLVAEGFIEPHFFAGFSGGRKSVLPGIASRTTVLANHCSKFIADDCSRAGVLDGNPIHRDMLYAGKKAGLAFIVNVVIDSDKKIIASFSGDMEKAHAEGCKFVKDLAGIDAVKSDIVITTNGGYPLDQNVYQAVKGMTAGEAAVNTGGVIIELASCSDGHGGKSFYNTFCNDKSVRQIMDEFMAIPMEKTIIDQWESQILARILLKATVILVSDISDEIVENLRMVPAKDVTEALKKAKDILGKENPSLAVIPDGVSVIVK